MIGLDTNVLLRAMLNDDPIQSKVAQRILSTLDRDRPGFVNIVVMMEFFWVLKSRYGLSRERLAAAVRNLLEVEHLEFESLDAVGGALVAYEDGVADFPDKVISMRNREAGMATTLTFDKKAARLIPSMELLT